MYLDPGSGSLILQVVLASILGVAVFFGLVWKRIKSIFTKNKSDQTTDNDQN